MVCYGIFWSGQFATLETRRKLGRVHFRKDFWDGYWGQWKNWPIADQHVRSNDPRSLRKTRPSFPLVSKVANLLH